MSNTYSRSSTGGKTSNSLPRIALVGCGAIMENYYLPALVSDPRVLEGLIFVDKNVDRARQLAAKFGANQFVADYHEVLDKVDGAINALPTDLHHPVSVDFLERGIPVLCEKPLAESAGKAREMIQAAEKNGALLCANYLQRLIPVFAATKEWIRQKTFGELLAIEYIVGEEFDWPSVSGFYFNSATSARGILRDRGAHALDHVCWWLGGKPKLICSQNDSFGGSDAVAHVKFEYGRCVGEMKLSWLATFPSRFKLIFEAGVLEGDVYDYQNLFLESKPGQRRRLAVKSELKTKPDVARKVVWNFLDVMARKAEPLVPGAGVLDSIEFIDECYAGATRFPMPWYEVDEVKNG